MRFVLFLLCISLLCGCSAPAAAVPSTAAETVAQETSLPEQTSPPTEVPTVIVTDPIQVLINGMTIEERVGQIFLARCDSPRALQDIEDYYLGGLVLFGEDFEGQTPDTVRETLRQYQDAAYTPLLIAVDEEGGSVTRISRYPAFREGRFPSPRQAFSQGGLDIVYSSEDDKCRLLTSLGINVNLGPVCDITTDAGAFMYDRSLGQDPQTTGEFVSTTVAIMRDHRVGSVLKHFPGYGNNADTHTGIALDGRSLNELEAYDLIPFSQGIEAGCGAILVSHTVVQAMDAELPASLSPAVHRYLRREMGFEGVILTDDLYMQAITDLYGPGEAAVLAVLAGNDLLCSTDYITQYEAVLRAVLEDRIPLETLDAAIYRVLSWKQELGLL